MLKPLRFDRFTANATGTASTFPIPANATSGTFTVTTAAGTGTSTGTYCTQYRPTATGSGRCGAGTVVLTAAGAPTSGGT